MENYEKKLKLAKEALESGSYDKESIEYIFPELKESEDERIRKSIIENLKGNMYRTDSDYDLFNKQIAWLEKLKVFSEHGYGLYYFGNNGFTYVSNPTCDNVSWIEKQGEKPQGKTAFEAVNEEKVDNANKVEPKFHEGEWVVWENQYYKVNYNGCGYELVDQNGLSTSLEYGTVDENARLWDITKDAKNGDVLVSDNIVFIFNKIHDVWINCHCSLYEDDSFYGGDFDLMHIRYGKEVYPATKEQRDALMKAMAYSGWQFDFEKKELKKKEPKFKIKLAGREYNVLEIKESAGVTFYGIEDEPNHIDYVLSDDCEIISGYGEKEKGSQYPTKSAIFSGQNHAWSKEDEKIALSIEQVMNCASLLNLVPEKIEKVRAWLRTLKQRIYK